MTARLRIAVQKSGRLADRSLELLRDAGLRVVKGASDLLQRVENAPVDLLRVRDDDIPTFVADGVATFGVVGQNVLDEDFAHLARRPEVVMPLGFGRCTLKIATVAETAYAGAASLAGKRIATSYPNILERWLGGRRGGGRRSIRMKGSVEVAPRLGVAHAICDLVSTGATLEANGLVARETVFESEAVLIRAPLAPPPELAHLADILAQRFAGVVESQGAKYILMNAPRANLPRDHRYSARRGRAHGDAAGRARGSGRDPRGGGGECVLGNFGPAERRRGERDPGAADRKDDAMKNIDWASASVAERAAALARPPRGRDGAVTARVAEIFADVEARGDTAVADWAVRLDGHPPRALAIDAAAIATARAAVPPEDADALAFAADAVRRYHEATRPVDSAPFETVPGATVTRVWRPVETAGLYVPGGTAPLFSTLLMLAIPAAVAGVPHRVAMTPPAKDGGAHPMMVLAAHLAGLKTLWLVGGAHGIAALALGAGLPRATKIFGPGNVWVAEAKRQAADRTGGPAIDMPAGPSELMVVADGGADLRVVAADLLSQAEHDADAQVILVAVGAGVADAVTAEVDRQVAALPRAAIARAALASSRALVVAGVDEALAIINAYAPEHLSLNCAGADALVQRVRAAGTVFVGPHTAETFGDYLSGPSHVLPTDAAARAWSGVGVASFMTSFAVQTATAAGAARLAPMAARLARAEGLEAHARAADARGGTDPAPVRPIRRAATVVRDTNETRIVCAVELDSPGPSRIATGIGFYDHMLEQVARHGGLSILLAAEGDLHIEAHHTIEDCALALGEALRQALGDRKGVARFGFVAPLDEAEAAVTLDLSGRPLAKWEGEFKRPMIGDYPTEMTAHVFRSLADAMRATIHVKVTGEDDHHKTEAAFKSFGRALRQAIRVEGDAIPSTKGVLA